MRCACACSKNHKPVEVEYGILICYTAPTITALKDIPMVEIIDPPQMPQQSPNAIWIERLIFIIIPLSALIVGGLTIWSRHNMKPPVITSATATSSIEKETKNITFPYTKMEGQPNEITDYTVMLAFIPGEATEFNIIPDDCIEKFEINGIPVIMDEDAQKHRCDWVRGIIIDLKPYLKNGNNQFHLNISNAGGPTGLNIKPQIP
jgi:hypothetical protein